MSKESEIMQAIADHLGLDVSDVDRNASLRDDLSLGPLELNDLLNDLSQKFSVQFESDEISSLKRVEDLIVTIEDNLLG